MLSTVFLKVTFPKINTIKVSDKHRFYYSYLWES